MQWPARARAVRAKGQGPGEECKGQQGEARGGAERDEAGEARLSMARAKHRKGCAALGPHSAGRGGEDQQEGGQHMLPAARLDCTHFSWCTAALRVCHAW